MADEAAESPHDVLVNSRDNFVKESETFLMSVISGFGGIEKAIREAGAAHGRELEDMKASHAAEVQRLNLVATTAAAAANESVRHKTALAVAEVENGFAARSEKLVTAAREEAANSHAEAISALNEQHAIALADAETRHEEEIRGLAREAARSAEESRDAAVEALRAEMTATSAASRDAAVEAARAELTAAAAASRQQFDQEMRELREAAAEELRAAGARHEEALAEAASGHAAALALQASGYETKLAGSRALWLAADGARMAAEGKASEAEAIIEDLRGQLAAAPLASEIESILFPQPEGQESAAEQLAEARQEIEALRESEREAAGTIATLRGQVSDAVDEKTRVEEDLRRHQGQAAPTCNHEPQDTTSVSMRVARMETQNIVRLVADGNPDIMLTEAADLLAAALTGRTEMAMSLPVPVLVEAAS